MQLETLTAADRNPGDRRTGAGGGSAVFTRPLSGCQKSASLLRLALTRQMNSSPPEEAGRRKTASILVGSVLRADVLHRVHVSKHRTSRSA